MLMKVIKTTKGIEKINSRPRIITLVGPTGVGKTTTAAKNRIRTNAQVSTKSGDVDG